MTEPPRRDDEIVSAVLDGEATPEERARVDGDGNLARRLAEFRSVSDVVGDPVQTVDAATREANIAQALRSADDHGGRDDAEVIGLDRAERRWRPDLNRKVLVTVAAVVGFLALAGGLLTVGDGNEAQDQAGGTADRAEAPTGDLAVPDLDLGAVDDVETLRLRINEATGLDRQADDTEAFAAAENAEGAVGAPATDEGSPTSSTPADGADPSGALDGETCAVELVESRPALIGQLAEGSVTYQGVDAHVFVYNDADREGAVGFVTATADCRVLAEVPL